MADRVFTSNINYESDAINLFNRISSQPSYSRKILINEIIFQLKTNLIWDELDAIWFLGASDSQLAKLNWKSSSYNLTELGTMNFVTDKGYTRNGSVAGTVDSLDTNYIPSAGVKATLNSNSFGIYSRTNVNEGSADIGSLTSGNVGYQINSRNTGSMQVRNNASTAFNTTVSDSLGLFSVVRASNTFTTTYKNGISVGTSVVAATALSSFPLYLTAANVNNVIAAGSTRQLAFAYIGSANIDQTKLYSIVQFYMANIGAAI